jgi:polyhydroxyalkanoate synthesis regulator phasin
MSDFLTKFKSIFVVTEPSDAKAAEQKAAAAPANSAPAANAPATAPPPVSAPPADGSVSDRFVELLSKALEANNRAGFDYFEFRQSLVNLGKMAMDEATRFKSAFAMAQTMNITKDQLMESAQYYIQILNGEQSKFNEAHAQQRAKAIGSREQEVQNLENAIQQKTQQIAELTKQIEEHKAQSEQLRQEIKESTIKIESTRADFEATFSSIVAQLQEDMVKIKQYL